MLIFSIILIENFVLSQMKGISHLVEPRGQNRE